MKAHPHDKHDAAIRRLIPFVRQVLGGCERFDAKMFLLKLSAAERLAVHKLWRTKNVLAREQRFRKLLHRAPSTTPALTTLDPFAQPRE